MKSSQRSRICSATILMGVLAALSAPSLQAGLTTPFYVASTQPILDEFGVPLLGASDVESGRGDLVMLLLAEVSTDPNGAILPPSVTRMPDPGTPAIWNGITSIGNDTPSADPHSGMFSMTFGLDRPAGGTRFFVRVYNAPTIAEATYYADSQVFTVQATTPCMVDIASTDQPIDPGDEDGDGVSNSMEQSLASATDYDNDFLSDMDEYWAGTNPVDPASVMRVEQLTPVSGGFQVTWQSVPGKSYVVQGQTLGTTGYVDLTGSVSASTNSTSTTINPPASGLTCFRVVLESQ